MLQAPPPQHDALWSMICSVGFSSAASGVVGTGCRIGVGRFEVAMTISLRRINPLRAAVKGPRRVPVAA